MMGHTYYIYVDTKLGGYSQNGGYGDEEGIPCMFEILAYDTPRV
jgi:hypothetical protein